MCDCVCARVGVHSCVRVCMCLHVLVCGCTQLGVGVGRMVGGGVFWVFFMMQGRRRDHTWMCVCVCDVCVCACVCCVCVCVHAHVHL